MIKNSYSFNNFKIIFFNTLDASISFKFTYILVFSLTCFSCKNDRLLEEKIDCQSKIKEINLKLEESFKNGSIISEDLYVYVLKSGESLDFYCNLDYDSEGWPNRGHAYYFYQGTLIGRSDFFCDGCIEKDLLVKLKNMKIIKGKTPYITEYDKIVYFDDLDDELRIDSNKKIEYAKTLKSKTDNQNIPSKIEVNNIFKGSDILTFEYDNIDDLYFGKYIFVINRNDLLLYSNVRGTSIQNAKIINNKIVSNEFPENCYVISDGNLNILNPETKEVELTYKFNGAESSCDVEKYFK